MGDDILTMTMVLLVVLAILWSGWPTGVKQWIATKVNAK